MLFSDKLKILMEITDTSNKALAKHLIVDPSMISQLRTGARNVTKKNNHVKNMAFYFAGKCQSQSRTVALYELIRNDELKNDCSITRLSDIIYEFLTKDNTDEIERTTFYPTSPEIFKSNPRIRKSELTPHEIPDTRLIVCRSIEEKKEYMKKLFEYYMTLKSPNIIYFSSEEIVDWIYNDPVFYNNFRSWCLALINKGFSFVRIMKPMENREYFLKNILLWLPIYMTGQVHLYYYPHFRDDIYRQTIITLDNAASYTSSSIAKTNTCYYSFFSTDASLSSAYVKQIKDYLALCRPSFYICKSEQNIAAAFSDLMMLPGDRITKSFNLSPESIPYKEMLEYMSTSDSEEYRMAVKTVNRLYSATENARTGNVVIDMCTLASVEDIKGGKVRLQLPGYVNQTPVYYNADLYAIHLRNILRMLETNPNYHFYPLSPSEFGDYGNDYSPISVVDNQALMLVTDKHVLHFIQPDIIHTMYEHLYRESKIQAKKSENREQTMVRIQELLAQL
jgi:hypothetical protein